MALNKGGRDKAAADASIRFWTEEEFAAFRVSMTAMLEEARRMGLSHWELRPASGDGSVAVRMARRIHRRRDARTAAFHYAELFGEPAWDIMLALFLADEEGHVPSIADAFLSAGVSADVGPYHLARLERRGLVERHSGPDGDRISLSDETLVAMRRYLEESHTT